MAGAACFFNPVVWKKEEKIIKENKQRAHNIM